MITHLFGCAPVPLGPPERPLGDQQVSIILSDLRDQDRRVSSFYSFGRLSAKRGYWEPDSSILAAGTRHPFRIKIELTHPWGQPLLHVLIEGGSLGILSFPDKKLFLGDFTPETLSRFLGARLDLRLVWAVLRGYPNLPADYLAVSREANQIALLSEGGVQTETIEVSPESLLPKAVSLPEGRVRLLFLNLQEAEGIRHAGEVRVIVREGERNVSLKRERGIFNRSVPEQIFELPRPPGFEVIDLDKSKGPLP